MNKIIKKTDLFKASHWWLTSYHIFSFANYYDANNLWFWNLIVFNDDFIDWKSGFPLHPHSNAEILTIVLDWEITHGDTLWNKDTIKKWEIQTMTAWSWVFHSEENNSSKDTHLYQIWFKTHTLWLKPSYKKHKINLENNSINLLSSGDIYDEVWYLNSNVKVYRWIFDKWEKFSYDIKKSKGLFLYLYQWSIKTIIWNLESMYHIRFDIEWEYKFDILKRSDFILIEVDLVE